jgi:transposase
MSESTVSKLDQESDEFGRVFSSVIELLREEGKTETETRKEAFESFVRYCNAKTRREKFRLIVNR